MSLIAAGTFIPNTLEIPNSGIFSSDYLWNNFPGVDTNDKVATYSVWVKKLATGAYQNIWDNRFNDTNYFTLRFNTLDQLQLNSAATVVNADASTTEVFRDVGQWYHIVLQIDTTQATTTDRRTLFVNGVEQNLVDTNAIDLNSVHQGSIYLASWTNHIGMFGNGSSYHNGCFAEFNVIDGTVVDPSEFGQLDQYDVWQPKKYKGVYGNNGFYLDFSNGVDLGEDKSGNGHDWTNVGVTQGNDTPTNNKVILNILNHSTLGTIVAGGLGISGLGNVSFGRIIKATVSIPLTGKWYCEGKMTSLNTSAQIIGIIPYNQKINDANVNIGTYLESYGYGRITITYGDTALKYNNATVVTLAGVAPITTDIIGVAYDADAGTLEIFKNNVSEGVIFTSIPSQEYAFGCSGVIDIGWEMYFEDEDFTYTPPSGYKSISLNSLDEPEIVDPEKYFKAIAYDDGTGAKVVGFQPDLVWFKSRGSAFNHKLVDSVRGATKSIACNSDAVEETEATGLTSFDANGFTVGADTDYSDQTGTGMVAWNFKKKAGFFDIVSYSGSLTGIGTESFSHNLSVAPELIIVCCLETLKSNAVKCPDAGSANHVAYMNLANAFSDVSANGNMPADTNSLFYTNWTGGLNENAYTYIAYLFASVEGFSKIGKYTGNGLTDGTFINCGFRPAFVLMKRSDSTGSWYLIDNIRNGSNQPTNQVLYPNLTNVEVGLSVDILSNGFKLRSTGADLNANNGSVIYMAIAERPFKYSRAR